MSEALEDKDSPALKARLQALGFEQKQFEPKVNNRFIVYIDNFPSYVIKGVKLPEYSPTTSWKSTIDLECYNPIGENLEEKAISLVNEGEVTITIKLLSPVATVDTVWVITASDGKVNFGSINWSDEGQANRFHIEFTVQKVDISYPKT